MLRDALLGRPVIDLDVACRDPRDAARRFANGFGGGAVSLVGAARRVAGRAGGVGRDRGLHAAPHGIEADLATRDFTLNAIAIPVAAGDAEYVDPHGGRADLEARVLRAVSDGIFDADPLRLLRAVRLEDELGLRMDERTEALLRGARERVETRRANASSPSSVACPPLGIAGWTRSGCWSRSAGRSAARSTRSRPGLPARCGLRRGRGAVPDLARVAALRDGAAPSAPARCGEPARAPPLPPRDRAVVARGARVRGRGGSAGRCRGGSAR